MSIREALRLVGDGQCRTLPTYPELHDEESVHTHAGVADFYPMEGDSE